jgi:hypothetical protein
LRQDRLVAQDEDLDLFGLVGTSVQHQPAHERYEDPIDRHQRHRWVMQGRVRGRTGRSSGCAAFRAPTPAVRGSAGRARQRGGEAGQRLDVTSSDAFGQMALAVTPAAVVSTPRRRALEWRVLISFARPAPDHGRQKIPPRTARFEQDRVRRLNRAAGLGPPAVRPQPSTPNPRSSNG